MEIQILKEEFKEAIKKDNFLKAELAAVNKVSTWTLDRWRYENNPMLTTATNLSIIRKHLKLSDKVRMVDTVKEEATA